MGTPFYRALNIDTTGELADMFKAQPGACVLRIYHGDKEMTGAFGGLAADGAMELHLDDTKDARREARRAAEAKAVKDQMDARDLASEVSPAQAAADEFNRKAREKAAKDEADAARGTVEVTPAAKKPAAQMGSRP